MAEDEEEKVESNHGKGQTHSAGKLNRRKFDFLYKRTSFRAMAEFFKSLFASFVKKGVSGCNKKVHKSFKQHI